jgi:transposase
MWVPDPTTRANRKLLRGDSFVVRTRTRLKNRVHSCLAEINFASPATDLFGKQGRIWMDSLSLPEEMRFQVDGLPELLDFLELRIRRTAKRTGQRVDMTPDAQLLLTVPDIGAKTAMLTMAESGDLSRFPTSHHLTSFAGLVPTTRSSGGKTTHGSLLRAGSPWLRWALVETTQTLKMKPGPVRHHFTWLALAKGNSKATVAAARKLCCYLFWMLKDQSTYPEWLHKRNGNQLLEVRPT